MISKFITILILSTILIFNFVNSTTLTLIVDVTKNNNYPVNSFCGNEGLTCNSIKDAINYFGNWSSSNGNTPGLQNQLNLLLADGIYSSVNNSINSNNLNVTINTYTIGSTQVSFVGSNTITNPLFNLQGSNVIITGIQFSNFNSTSSLINCDSSFIYLNGTTFTSISSSNGTIFTTNSILKIDGSKFTKNSISNVYGSVISYINSNNNNNNFFEINGSSFIGSRATNGGAIYAVNTGNTNSATNSTINNSAFSSNSAQNGGDLYLNNINVNVVSSKFYNSSASADGLIIYNQNNNLNIIDSTFSTGSNTGYFLGAIIYVYYSKLTITGTTSDKVFSVAIDCDSSIVVSNGNSYAFKLVCSNCEATVEGAEQCSGSPLTSTGSTSGPSTSSSVTSSVSSTSSSSSSSPTSSSSSPTTGTGTSSTSSTSSSSTSNTVISSSSSVSSNGNSFTVVSTSHTSTTGSTSNVSKTTSSSLLLLLSISLYLMLIV